MDIVDTGTVFLQNIANRKCHSLCLNGLQQLVTIGLPEALCTQFDNKLDDVEYQKFIPDSLVTLFLESASIKQYNDFDGMLNWMSCVVIHRPIVVLDLLERLIIHLNNIDEKISFYKPNNLLITLKMLMQEADTLDDEGVIERVLKVQDWFIDIGVREVEDLLETF